MKEKKSMLVLGKEVVTQQPLKLPLPVSPPVTLTLVSYVKYGRRPSTFFSYYVHVCCTVIFTRKQKTNLSKPKKY